MAEASTVEVLVLLRRDLLVSLDCGFPYVTPVKEGRDVDAVDAAVFAVAVPGVVVVAADFVN